MRIRKYGHSCLQVIDGDASLLIDPGTFSAGYDAIRDLTAVLITHAHSDHLDVAGLGRVLTANPGAMVYADAGSAALLASDPATAELRVAVVRPGDVLDIGTSVEVFGGRHAVIHADIPVIDNVGYLIGGRLAHPGDSLVAPDRAVEVLALPVMAPWMAVKEAIDYLRAVAPRRAIPIHEGWLANPAALYRIITSLAPTGLDWHEIDDGSLLEV